MDQLTNTHQNRAASVTRIETTPRPNQSKADQMRIDMVQRSPTQAWKKLQQDRTRLRQMKLGAAMRALKLPINAKTYIKDMRSHLEQQEAPLDAHTQVMASYLEGYEALGHFMHLSECTGDKRMAALGLPTKPCSLGRLIHPKLRKRYEAEALKLIEQLPSEPVIVDVGSGGLFQTMVILVQAAAQSRHKKMTIHLLDPIYQNIRTSLLDDFKQLLGNTDCSFTVHHHVNAETCLALLPERRQSLLVLGADLIDFSFPERKVLTLFESLLKDGGRGLRLAKQGGPHLMHLSCATSPWDETSNKFGPVSNPLSSDLKIRRQRSQTSCCVLI